MLTSEEIVEKLMNYKLYTSDEAASLLREFLIFREKKGAIDPRIADEKAIYLVVAPSGSGKTTFIANLAASGLLSKDKKVIPVINRFLYNTNVAEPEGKSKVYKADEIIYKAQLAAEGKSFLMEIASFDEDYLEFIKTFKREHGYKLCVMYLGIDDILVNLNRVLARKHEGGHGRPSEELSPARIAKMHQDIGRNLAAIMPEVDTFVGFDNSREKPRILAVKRGPKAELEFGRCVYNKDSVVRIFYPKLCVKQIENVFKANMEAQKGGVARVFRQQKKELEKNAGGAQDLIREMKSVTGSKKKKLTERQSQEVELKAEALQQVLAGAMDYNSLEAEVRKKLTALRKK